MNDFLLFDGITGFPIYKTYNGNVEKLLKIMSDWAKYSTLLMKKAFKGSGNGNDPKSKNTDNIH